MEKRTDWHDLSEADQKNADSACDHSDRLMQDLQGAPNELFAAT